MERLKLPVNPGKKIVVLLSFKQEKEGLRISLIYKSIRLIKVLTFMIFFRELHGKVPVHCFSSIGFEFSFLHGSEVANKETQSRMKTVTLELSCLCSLRHCLSIYSEVMYEQTASQSASDDI